MYNPVHCQKNTIFSPFIPSQCWSVLCASNLLAALVLPYSRGLCFPVPPGSLDIINLGGPHWASCASAGSSRFFLESSLLHTVPWHIVNPHVLLLIVLVCDIKFVIFLPQLPHAKNVGMCLCTQWLVLAGKKKCTVRIRLQAFCFLACSGMGSFVCLVVVFSSKIIKGWIKVFWD